jgi:hypothetical protein
MKVRYIMSKNLEELVSRIKAGKANCGHATGSNGYTWHAKKTKNGKVSVEEYNESYELRNVFEL